MRIGIERVYKVTFKIGGHSPVRTVIVRADNDVEAEIKAVEPNPLLYWVKSERIEADSFLLN